MTIEITNGQFDQAVILLAIVGAFHTLLLFSRNIRFLAVELRHEIREWRRFFAPDESGTHLATPKPEERLDGHEESSPEEGTDRTDPR
jgi:hypothetical protein